MADGSNGNDGVEDERVTADSYGSLDTKAVESECWMIRIPQKLAELWEKAPEGTDLGELIFTKGGGVAGSTGGGSTGQTKQPPPRRMNKNSAAGAATTKPSVMIQVSATLEAELKDLEEKKQQEEEGDSSSNNNNSNGGRKAPSPATRRLPSRTAPLPLNYTLQAMTKRVPVMHPFSRNPRNGSVKLWGTVSRTANMQVDQDKRYRALMKDRLINSNVTSSRFVKPVEATESVLGKQKNSSATAATAASSNRSASNKTFGDAVYQYGKNALDAAQNSSLLEQQQGNSKKARRFAPDQPIKSVIFELFSQQQYWTVRDLKMAAVQGGASNANTKRAETEIRDVLREIGDYHRSGDHKNMWELQQGYK